VHAGHYAGATAQGEPVSFDVTADGDVTNVIASLSGAVISISQRFSVDEQGRWGGDVAGRGVRAQIRGRLGPEVAKGTVEAELASHATGAISWRARRVAGLAY
jgi:hypothetical protein